MVNLYVPLSMSSFKIHTLSLSQKYLKIYQSTKNTSQFPESDYDLWVVQKLQFHQIHRIFYDNNH